jgi:hypothetical protein
MSAIFSAEKGARPKRGKGAESPTSSGAKSPKATASQQPAAPERASQNLNRTAQKSAPETHQGLIKKVQIRGGAGRPQRKRTQCTLERGRPVPTKEVGLFHQPASKAKKKPPEGGFFYYLISND